MDKKQEKLIVDISEEEVTISMSYKKEILEVVHWTRDEWEEDISAVPSILFAINLAYTDPNKLIQINKKHIDSQKSILFA